MWSFPNAVGGSSSGLTAAPVLVISVAIIKMTVFGVYFGILYCWKPNPLFEISTHEWMIISRVFKRLNPFNSVPNTYMCKMCLTSKWEFMQHRMSLSSIFALKFIPNGCSPPTNLLHVYNKASWCAQVIYEATCCHRMVGETYDVSTVDISVVFFLIGACRVYIGSDKCAVSEFPQGDTKDSCWQIVCIQTSGVCLCY